MEAKDKIIVALDVDNLDKAEELVGKLYPYAAYFKAGLELLTTEGAPTVVKRIYMAGGKIFYDGKFMDIPNTVAAAARAVTRLGVQMFNVHCLGGAKMMRKAQEASKEEAKLRGVVVQPLILGVTLLTSLDYGDLVEMNIQKEIRYADSEEQEKAEKGRMETLVQQLAWLAQDSGLDGVVASPKEIEIIRKYCQPEFLIVTPGVRPKWASVDDQKRVMTPAEAIKAGADYLVIGRPITKPPAEIGGSVEAAKRIVEEIAAVM